MRVLSGVVTIKAEENSDKRKQAGDDFKAWVQAFRAKWGLIR